MSAKVGVSALLVLDLVQEKDYESEKQLATCYTALLYIHINVFIDNQPQAIS